MCRKKGRIKHPFLYTYGSHLVHGGGHIPLQESRYTKCYLTVHHLYPKSRTQRLGQFAQDTICLWSHKHFFGWNSLFQFVYPISNGKYQRSEFTIDEIITHMRIDDPFIVQQVDTRAWKIVFKNRNHLEAADLLERLLQIKYKRSYIKTVNELLNTQNRTSVAA